MSAVKLGDGTWRQEPPGNPYGAGARHFVGGVLMSGFMPIMSKAIPQDLGVDRDAPGRLVRNRPGRRPCERHDGADRLWNGHGYECSQCRKENKRRHREQNIDAIRTQERERKRRYREQNMDVVRAQERERRRRKRIGQAV